MKINSIERCKAYAQTAQGKDKKKEQKQSKNEMYGTSKKSIIVIYK